MRQWDSFKRQSFAGLLRLAELRDLFLGKRLICEAYRI
jgi:hypothetical protein